MILHQQGPSYVLFNLASKPASAVCWEKLLTWNISPADFVKALLLLQPGAGGTCHMCCPCLWLWNAAVGRPASELQVVSWASRSIRRGLRRAFTPFGVFIPLGLSGLVWELVVGLFWRWNRIYSLGSNKDRRRRQIHGKAVLGSEAQTNVSIHAKFPSARFDTAKSNFVPV